MALDTFVPVAPGSDFPLENLPFGVFSRRRQSGGDPSCCCGRVGVALGEHVVDLGTLSEAGAFTGPMLSGADCFRKGSLNEFMALGYAAWQEARTTLTRLLSSAEGVLRDDRTLQEKILIPQSEVTMHLPARIGDYTDFYASKEHATNVGTIFRGKDNALQPNWCHLPVAYHGRASSIVPSGTDVKRPRGQTLKPGSTQPHFVPSAVVDFELEMGAFVGPGNQLGSPIPIESAKEHIFGIVLLNDWSARDIQKWEYVPLGPFNGKNWATTVSPWVVTLDALEPFECPAPVQEPPVLPYLREQHRTTYDVQLEVQIQPRDSSEAAAVSASNLRHLYWTFPQMVAHHTSSGCNLRPGDLLGTGTISCEDGPGSLLELSWAGQRQIAFECGGSTHNRCYLMDGDTVILKGHCAGPNGRRIGFGECRGRVLPDDSQC
ncbi:unnamed protein product [Ostreobium quekettii]|uniref:Fumarylacetoacetase n=1 Tax=Ostreobium quekettii TaxID=121088 RepID=A0A8S1JAY4_9CHLO|nr:unnamed protein product [Ostreobium quekettii]|eukprot:evm.model.scf_620.4 EVM.evm.TU.scf_620.4   scf_620:31955-41263(+)